MIINKEFGYTPNELVTFKRHRIKKLAIQSGCEITLRIYRDYDRFQRKRAFSFNGITAITALICVFSHEIPAFFS